MNGGALAHNIKTICQRHAVVPLLGGFLGLTSFAASLGLVLANPSHVEWLLNGDWKTHFLGWHLYRPGPWTFPLGASPLLAWPIGSSVGLTDSLPIFAVLFKLLGPALPSDFQYIGLWLLLSFVLQGVVAAMLMQLFTLRPALQILGSALLVMSPPLLLRIGHPALTAHWLLLAALWLYLRKGAELPSRASFAGWVMVVSVAAAVHPYMALMVLTLANAAHIRQAIARPSNTLLVLSQAVVLSALAAVVLWQSGYFIVSGADDLQVGGFGFYSMNLLAPIMPSEGLTLFSRGPIAYASGGQYEGYAYMGAGILLLGVIAVMRVARSLQWPTWNRRHWQHLPLVLACIGLALLALSPIVTMGSRTLFEYDPAWWGPLSVFRASGRMFWPVYYLMVLGVLIAVTTLGYRRALVIMVVAVVLQIVDLSGHYRGMQGGRDLRFVNPLVSPFWSAVAPHYKHLTLVPTAICAPDDSIEHTPFSLLAGRYGLTINAGASARYDVRKAAQYCDSMNKDLVAGKVSGDTLYVLQPRLVPRFRAAASTPLLCSTVDQFGVCVVAQTYALWQDSFDVMATALPSVMELTAFYGDLDNEYRLRLQRPARAVRASPTDRLSSLSRYLWYRVTGCGHAEATQKTLREVRGDKELRICGNFTETHSLPPPDETFDFWKQLEVVHRAGSVAQTWTTHVDPEGEAVWMHTYMRERLNGRDVYGARVAVLSAIQWVVLEGR